MIYNVDPEQAINKALLAFSIETVLMRLGTPYYEKVTSRLENEYQISISDCDKNPEALRQILHDIFGKSYEQILGAIKSQIGEASIKKYSAFLDGLDTRT